MVFFRCGLSVEHQDVVAEWKVWHKTPGSESLSIHRGKHDRKRCCFPFFTKDIPKIYPGAAYQCKEMRAHFNLRVSTVSELT